jgi:hypothetical protein
MKNCLYCGTEGGWTDEHVLQNAFGTSWVLTDDVCGACNSGFSALATKLVEFVRNFAYLGHPDVKPVFRLMDGQLGLMPTPSGWQTVRVENGKPITLPQLIFTGQTQIQFVRWREQGPASARADVSKIIGELGDIGRLRLERKLVDVAESQPAIVRSSPRTYMLRAPTEKQLEELGMAVRSGALFSSMQTRTADSPNRVQCGEPVKFEMKWDLGAIWRAVAKSSLNFICKALGSSTGRLPEFDAIRTFVRGENDNNEFVQLLLGDDSEQAAQAPCFVCRPGHHSLLFVGAMNPVALALSLYGRPFATVRVTTARFKSQVMNAVALFDYNRRTHEVLTAEYQPDEFVKLFRIADSH